MLTLKSQELSAPRKRSGTYIDGSVSTELRERLESWRRDRSIVSAAEVVETALVLGRDDEAIEAARFLVSGTSTAAPSVKVQAAMLLHRLGREEDVPDNLITAQDVHKRWWRHRTRVFPHDAIAWVELALHETIDNDLIRAEKSIATALQLTPNNRHVLRSASRFYVHGDDFGRAHDLIRSNSATPYDPWLLAAEISLSALADRSPRFIRNARALLEKHDFLPRQIAELAGAVATTDLIDGKQRKARRMFQQSIVDPTGNALAQAEWAATDLHDDIVTPEQLRSAPEPAEAQALQVLRDGDWALLPEICIRWAQDDPYSIRPYEAVSGSTGVEEDYETSERFAAQGLKRRPTAQSLLNGLAFAQANLGKLDAAERTLRKVPDSIDEPSGAVKLANQGLIAFRRGHYVRGTEMYYSAIDHFRKNNHDEYLGLAFLYFSREALIAGLSGIDEILGRARDLAEKTTLRSVRRVWQSIERLKAAKNDSGSNH